MLSNLSECVWEKRNVGAMWGWRCERKPNRPSHLCTIMSTTTGAQRTALMTWGTAGSVPGVPGTSDGELSSAPVGINRSTLQYLTAAMCWKETGNMSQNPISSFVGFCILFFFFLSHCDDCGPIEMACGSASSVFYSLHLSHRHRSDVTKSKVLSSSDVVVFRGG